MLKALCGLCVLGVSAYVTAGQTAARPENYTESVPGTKVEIEMVGIPGGTFTMGSPASEPGRGADEGPAHQVRIAPFWMGRTEITWDQYDAFAFSIPGTSAPASGMAVISNSF